MRKLRYPIIRGGCAALILLLAGLASGCHSSGTTVMVTVTPTTATLALQGTTSFFASVANATDTTVIWQVNGVTGGNSTCGTISTNGLYTAPTNLPASTACAGTTTSATACTTTTGSTTTVNSGCVLITAISNQDMKALGTASVTLVSGVTLTVTPMGSATMGTGETLSFLATVSGSTNLSVNWFVNTVQGGSATSGLITSTTVGNGTLANAAIYTAPAMVPTPSTVTIEAQAVADTTQTQTIVVAISTAVTPSISSIIPLMIPQGAVLEDLYLSGSSFLSTTTVLFSGVDISTIPGGSVTAISGDVIRARIPGSLLGSAGTFTIAAQAQNKTTNQSLPVQVVPVRPSLIAATPVTLAQNSPTTTLELAGGYFTPSTLSEWNGHLVSSTPDAGFPRTLQASINSSDLTEAGLFQIAVRTPSASPPRSALNVAVRPPAGPVAPNSTISGFMQPVAVAVNDVTGLAMVVDQAQNQLDLLNAGLTGIATQIPVGTTPSSVAVDGLRNLALVTDTGSNDLAVVDLTAQALTATLSCLGSAPVAVGVDELHGRALVVNQNGSAATILDTTHPMTCPVVQSITSISRASGTVTVTLMNPLTIPGGNGSGVVTISGVADASFDGTFVVLSGSASTTLTWAQAGSDGMSNGGSAATGSILGTVPATTGAKPQVAVVPQLGWAIVTPGGAGVLSVVDLTRLTLVFSVGITSTTRGIAVNTETKTLLLADPSSGSVQLFNLRDQSISNLALGVGNLGAAANPFTNVGLLLNPGAHQAFVVDLNTPAQLATVPLGSDPIAVALDPATNMALVADDVDGTVTVVDLGVTRSRLGEPQLLQVSPTFVVGAGSPIPIQVIGAGFLSGSQIRLNETPIATTFVSSRQLTANIPAGSLTQPLRIVVDVQNSPALFSNVFNLLVALPVAVGSSPQGVGIDQDQDRALVANSGDGTVSVIDISPTRPTFGTVISTLTVGNTPLAIGVVSRESLAVVSNSGSATASIINLNTNPFTVPAAVNTGAGPTGVGVSESLGTALITNTNSNSVTLFALSDLTAAMPTAIGVDAGPVAAAIAPDLNVAVSAQSTASTAIVLNVASGVPIFVSRATNIANAVGVDYDPVGQTFLILASGANTVVGLNPTSQLQVSVRTGVNPTSLAYNFQASTLLTLNRGSSTLSVVDLPALQVPDVLPFSGGTVYAIAIHRRLEFVVASDPANNRILIMPSPR